MPNLPRRGTRTPWHHKPSDRQAKELYRSAAWRKYRTRYLSANPVCTSCGRAATVVDHIAPARQRPELFWSALNHQSLCQDCHQRKRATED